MEERRNKMNLKKNLMLLLAALMIFSVLLGACATPTVEDVLEQVTEEPAVEATEEEVVELAAEPTEEVVEEPAEEPAEEATEEPVEEASVEDLLDANIGAFLAGMEGFNSTSPEAVYEQLVEGEVPFLIDVRTAEELEENGHVEGAIHIPVKELAQNVDKLPSTDTPIVVYCGVGTRAALAGTALAGLGYTDVKIMTGGSFGGWVDAGYPVVEGLPEEAAVLNELDADPAVVEAVDAMLQGLPEGYAQLAAEDLNTEIIDGADLTIIDVRTPTELAEKGMIEGAVHIPLDQLIASRADWPAQDEDILIYCGVGYRGNLAMGIMRQYGYENIRNLRGGFGAWVEAGLPVVEAEGVAAAPGAVGDNLVAFVDAMEGFNSLAPADLNTQLIEGETPFLLDVRNESELREDGHIEGAVHIPLRELAQNIDKLPAYDTPIVIYCGVGTRAALGATALAGLGYTDVKVLTGGSFGGWADAGFAVADGLPEPAAVLDAIDPDPAVVAAVDEMLTGLPEGYAQLAVEDLNMEIVEGAELTLIDVRTAQELADKGMIEGAIHIPLQELLARQDEWPAEDEDIVIYCGVGYRGNLAMGIMRQFGYENIRNVKGGFGAWAEAGLPVVTE